MTSAQPPPVRLFCSVVCLLLVASCDDGPQSPSVPFAPRFTLAPGQSTQLAPRAAFRFVQVTGDSRCPADALCIQGGDAIVHVEIVEEGGGHEGHELHTGDSRRATAQYRDLRIELAGLQPYPFSSRTIAPGDYRATFTVTTP